MQFFRLLIQSLVSLESFEDRHSFCRRGRTGWFSKAEFLKMVKRLDKSWIGELVESESVRLEWETDKSEKHYCGESGDGEKQSAKAK